MEAKLADTVSLKTLNLLFPKDDQRFQPEIVWQSSNGNNTQIVPLATMNHWTPGNAASMAVFREARDSYVQRLPKDWYNGVLNTFDGLTEHEDGGLHIKLGVVRYFDYLAAGLDEFKSNPTIEKPNPIVLSGILLTNDGKMVFGSRTAKTAIPRPGKEQTSQIGVFGGTYNRKIVIDKMGNEIMENGHPHLEMLEEVRDELGILDNEIDLGLHAILNDPVLHRTILLFIGNVNLTAQELNIRFIENGNKDEHFGIVFADTEPDSIQAIIRENITVATSMALAAVFK